MALDKPSLGVPPSVNYARLGAAFDLIDFVRAALDSKASVGELNTKADLGEFLNVRTRLNDAVDLLGFVRNALDSKASVGQLNTKADLGEFLALQADNKNKAYQVVVDILSAANGERARETRDLGERIDGLNPRFSAIEQAAQDLAALVAQAIVGGDQARPGDNPLAFTDAVQGGAISAIPALPSGLIATGDTGLVARLVGAGTVATRRRTALVRNHVYRARYVLQRNADPADPAGDAVDCAILYVDNRGAVIGGPVALVRLPTLRSIDGAREVTIRIGRDTGPRVDVVVPGSARAAAIFVRTYGSDGQTDIDTLELVDITDAGART